MMIYVSNSCIKYYIRKDNDNVPSKDVYFIFILHFVTVHIA